MESKFLQAFSEAIDRDIDTMNLSDIFREYEQWDSLSALSVLAMINEEFDVTIHRAELQEIQTIQQLIDYINKNK